MKQCRRSMVVRGIWIASFFITMIGTVDGQHAQTKAAASTKGTLSGRVFAITNSGDLKPARMADVYILFSFNVTTEGKAIESSDIKADNIFTEARLAAQELYLEQFKANYQWSDKEACMKDLETFRPSMIKAMEWAQDNKKQDQIVKTQTDEDGYFSVSLPARKKYHIYARGRAGFNEAYWDGDRVTVQPSMHVAMKLSSPETSCLDVPD
jgi:phosphopantetheinyl transferase (holo-ACP synthase)